MSLRWLTLVLLLSALACQPDVPALDAGRVEEDGGLADAGGGDGGSDAGIADGGTVDGGSGDAGSGDAGSGDGGLVDGGLVDGGSVDGGSGDGGADGGPYDAGPNDGGSADGGIAGDAGLDAGLPDGSTDAGPLDGGPDGGFPAVGVYTWSLDGGVLALLLDGQARELSHPRRLDGTPWIVATRYGQDPDLNGLALEDEDGIGAHYQGTEIVVFALGAPTSVHSLAGNRAGGLAANASWTEDGRLLYLHVDAGSTAPQLRRLQVAFNATPTVTGTEVLTLPAGVYPVDPHQLGPSDAGGRISFSGLVSLTTPVAGWAQPIFVAPASGTTSWAQVQPIGCPVCPPQTGCCVFPNLADLLATNDSRFNHQGTRLTWMQQDPAVWFWVGVRRVHPFRQLTAPLDGGPQVEFPAPGVPATTHLAYPEWSPDDSTLAYWVIEYTPPQLHLSVELMNADGTQRRRLPLPRSLCPQHPSFLDADTLIFSARRAGTGDDCNVALMRP